MNTAHHQAGIEIIIWAHWTHGVSELTTIASPVEHVQDARVWGHGIGFILCEMTRWFSTGGSEA